MIIFNNFDEMIKSLETEKEFLEYNIKSQEKIKNIILQYMQNFAYSTDNIDLQLVSFVLIFLENLKLSLNLCNDNISALNHHLNNLNDIINTSRQSSNEIINDKINSYILEYCKANKIVMENTIKIEECLYSISEKSELKFNDSIILNDFQSNHPEMQPQNISNEENNKIEDIKSVPSNDSSSHIKNNNYVENTLIVSQTSGNVVLPYHVSELKEILKENPHKYSSIDDIIIKDYTLPISLFKNPFISRFRESFKLMKNKEKSSIANSFELGVELMFNYNLHPAIISACKNLDELDIYLDYLENGETNKFDCFKIVFELPPAIVK
ncbi:MAG: hypothetical protein IJ777_00525 [Clostridia bacterium]|nr:hypothetical protein [Clostridia bacterium]